MSFTYRPKTPKNTIPKFLTEYQDCYNTFNKTNFSSFRDKITIHQKNNNYSNPTQQYSIFKSKPPIKYYNHMKGKDCLLVSNNGTPLKEYHPFITRENLSQFLKNRSNSIKFRRPCGCYSKYNISKYSQVWEHPECIRRDQYNTFYNKNQLPYINDNDNTRYIKSSNRFNGFMTPKINNKKSGKITYKLRGTLNNDNYRFNTETNNNYIINNNLHNTLEYENENKKVNGDEIRNKDTINEEKKDEINCGIENNINKDNNEENENDNCQKKINYFNLISKRRFHKVQIFNNYKPFLVDDFKEYGYYE